MSALIIPLAVSLALTLLIELSFALLTGLRDRTDLQLVALANIVTNPAVVLMHFVFRRYTLWNMAAVTAALELAAIVTEGLYYRRYARGIKRPFLFCLAANALSFTAGLFIDQLF